MEKSTLKLATWMVAGLIGTTVAVGAVTDVVKCIGRPYRIEMSDSDICLNEEEKLKNELDIMIALDNEEAYIAKKYYISAFADMDPEFKDKLRIKFYEKIRDNNNKDIYFEDIVNIVDGDYEIQKDIFKELKKQADANALNINNVRLYNHMLKKFDGESSFTISNVEGVNDMIKKLNSLIYNK